jgi:hypothetical protein
VKCIYFTCACTKLIQIKYGNLTGT